MWRLYSGGRLLNASSYGVGQSHFGWDWGPAFETMGVYGAVRIIEIPQASAAILRTTTEVVSDATPVTPATECPTCEVADLSSLSKFTVTSKIVVAFGASYSSKLRIARLSAFVLMKGTWCERRKTATAA